VAVPTVRDPDGLALSSRNAYLGEKERTAALLLSESLNLAKEIWLSGGTDTGLVKNRMRALIEGNPLARIDYVSIADGDTLEELDRLRRSALVSLAVNIGKTRLIDNVVL